MTLFDLTNEALTLYDLLQADEIDEEVYRDTLESIGLEQKLESCVYVLKQYEAEADMYKAEIDRLTARKKTAENNVERMKKSIIDYLTITGKDKEKAGTFSVRLNTSKAVNITDEVMIPDEYKIPQEPKINKKAIRDALKAGETIEGAELITNTGVVIR